MVQRDKLFFVNVDYEAKVAFLFLNLIVLPVMKNFLSKKIGHSCDDLYLVVRKTVKIV
jgi:hypothetical protein